MTSTVTTASASRLAGVVVTLVLLAARAPSLVQPAGGDQQLYAYAGHALAAGQVPYLDAWDQKPPGIQFVYAALWTLWPDDSVVPAADMLAAGLVAWLLILIGRRVFSAGVGYAAAWLFLLFGDPALQRLSGVWVRGQCETFIALAVAAAMALIVCGRRRSGTLVAAGMCLGFAFWLKYNAVVYALPLAAVVLWKSSSDRPGRVVSDLALVGLGAAALSAAVLGYFAWHGALGELWLATVSYNLEYSGETYTGFRGVIGYLWRMPVQMGRVDLLWFLGGVGSVALAFAAWREPRARIVLTWVVAGVLSIALNGARGLPQYFVQAQPALAFAAAAGGAWWLGRPAVWRRLVVAAVVCLGLWKVGTEPGLGALKLGGLPGAWSNLRFDWSHVSGAIDRPTYLARFERSGDKYVPLSAWRLATYVRDTTPPDESIYVFGFSAGVYLHADRRSASRFFWSRPVAVGFERDRAGYGPRGLLEDLEQDPPSLIALQKHWGAGDPDPMDFFLGEPSLRSWLEAGYIPDRDMPEYRVWRRRD